MLNVTEMAVDACVACGAANIEMVCPGESVIFFTALSPQKRPWPGCCQTGRVWRLNPARSERLGPRATKTANHLVKITNHAMYSMVR